MDKIIKECLEFLKAQDVNGCITGSVMLGTFEKQDVDVFLYTPHDFTKLLFALKYNKDFMVLDPLERWKYEKFLKDGNSSFKKMGIHTIKFNYKTALDLNIIVKKNADNIFSVLSSFDMDVISKGYDIKSEQYLDLSGDSHKTKIVNYNKWNSQFSDISIWNIGRMLRQFERIVKYYKRGYNTDPIANKYVEIIDELISEHVVFNKESVVESINNIKLNLEDMKAIILHWLKTHKMTDEEYENLVKLYKNF